MIICLKSHYYELYERNLHAALFYALTIKISGILVLMTLNLVQCTNAAFLI